MNCQPFSQNIAASQEICSEENCCEYAPGKSVGNSKIQACNSVTNRLEHQLPGRPQYLQKAGQKETYSSVKNFANERDCAVVNEKKCRAKDMMNLCQIGEKGNTSNNIFQSCFNKKNGMMESLERFNCISGAGMVPCCIGGSSASGNASNIIQSIMKNNMKGMGSSGCSKNGCC